LTSAVGRLPNSQFHSSLITGGNAFGAADIGLDRQKKQLEALSGNSEVFQLLRPMRAATLTVPKPFGAARKKTDLS
jgi:hypothetical protein